MNIKRFHSWYRQLGVVFAFMGSPFCFKGIKELTIAFLIVYALFITLGLATVFKFKRDLIWWFLLKELVVTLVAALYGYLFVCQGSYYWLSIIVGVLLLLPVNFQIEKRLK